MLKKLFILFVFILIFISCKENKNTEVVDVDYSDSLNWVCFPNTDYETDIFFVAPTVYLGDDTSYNMSINDETLRSKFSGAVNMEKGLYSSQSNFYAPYYRQASLNCFKIRGYNDTSSDVNVENAFNISYNDVEDAFEQYLSVSDKPFILAGFSQGAEMLIKLIKNKFSNEDIYKRFIAAYAIGWRLDPNDVNNIPHLKNAKSDDDIGVVICYSTEADFIDKSLIVPEYTLSINPLNWSTDTTFVDKTHNLGACFTDYNGDINVEINQFTGAFLDPKRGTLKVTDVNPDDYPPVLDIFKQGEYHIYDYMFFYRNIQENVKTRIDKYIETH